MPIGAGSSNWVDWLAVKLVRVHHLINVGPFTDTDAWKVVEAEIREAIASVVWPPGNDRFVINPSGPKHDNGVVPIRKGFIAALELLGWEAERPFPVTEVEKAPGRRPGPIDGTRYLSGFGLKPFVAEWETGNISSSHRAMNKMALALKRGVISGGLWIVPSGRLAPYLTDRIGNYPEFEPYFDLYTDLEVEFGYLGAAVVEHDDTDPNVVKLGKGRDGNAPAFKDDPPGSEKLPF